MVMTRNAFTEANGGVRFGTSRLRVGACVVYARYAKPEGNNRFFFSPSERDPGAFAKNPYEHLLYYT